MPFRLGLRRLLRRNPLDSADAQTVAALRVLLRPDSSCVDVGAHRGAVLEQIVALAPGGGHVAVEPLPRFAALLGKRFPGVAIHEAALSDTNGVSGFHHVVRAPAYSGLRRRRYEREDETVERIAVETRRLDDLLELGHRIDVLKIDVEGGELAVLRGAQRTLAAFRPAILFEHGLGAAEFYETGPADIHALLADELGYEIFPLAGWLTGAPPLDLAAMTTEFEQCGAYMFVAIHRSR